MPADERDPKFEHALERHLRGAATRGACADAQTLAAYHERTLSLEEMAQWKQHIAGCTACQETLSLVETTEKQLAGEEQEVGIPVLAAAEKEAKALGRTRSERLVSATSASVPMVMAGKRRSKLAHWAIPLGALAAGALIAIGVREQRAERFAAHRPVQVAENRPTAPPAPKLEQGQPQVREQEQASPNAVPPLERDAREFGTSGKLAAKPGSRGQNASGNEVAATGHAIPEGLRKDAEATKEEAKKLPSTAYIVPAGGNAPASAPAPTPAPPPPPPANKGKAAAPQSATETVEVTAAAPTVPASGEPVTLPEGSAAGGVAGGVLQDERRTAARSDAKTSQSQQAADSTANRMMLKQGVSPNALDALRTNPQIILTPDNKTWWRLGPNGTVELTTDAGKKWKTLQTGVTTQLTSGSAPSERVCWIAGTAGTLLRTTNRGGHWTRIEVPITGDLDGVHAVDADHASIWDAANRLSYETSDGGKTWKQIANE